MLAAELPKVDRRRRAGGARAAGHTLRLHRRPFPAADVAAFLEGGRGPDAGYFAVCSSSHWKAVRRNLAAGSAPCLFLDSLRAAKALAGGRAGSLDRLLARVEAIVLAGGGQGMASLRLFTDLGSRLRREGLDQEALRAEEALDDLCRRHGVTILCVYPVDDQDPRQRDYHQAMILHDRVLTA